ncbi:MAG: hypothetical protein AAF587_22555 [Bacteroidota bacterium]
MTHFISLSLAILASLFLAPASSVSPNDPISKGHISIVPEDCAPETMLTTGIDPALIDGKWKAVFPNLTPPMMEVEMKIVGNNAEVEMSLIGEPKKIIFTTPYHTFATSGVANPSFLYDLTDPKALDFALEYHPVGQWEQTLSSDCFDPTPIIEITIAGIQMTHNNFSGQGLPKGSWGLKVVYGTKYYCFQNGKMKATLGPEQQLRSFLLARH